MINNDPTPDQVRHDDAPDPPATETSTPPDTQPEPQGPNAEAARYRVRLREAEAASGALQARVDGLLRREVDRLTASALAEPGDLWEVGRVTLADLLDPDGDVDPALVEKAADELLATRPGLARVVRHDPDFGAGNRGNHTGHQGAAWSDVIGKNRRR